MIGDSTTVLLYKLVRAAVDAQLARDPARREIVVDSDNFPTDRYVLEGIAHERGMRLRWIEVDTSSGVTAEHLAEAVGPETALVVLSHVAYRSAYLAEAHELTRIAHDAGALVLWDLCHSAGSVPVDGGRSGASTSPSAAPTSTSTAGRAPPRSPTSRDDLQGVLAQPIQGWMGTADVFAMGPEYAPASGMRRFLSGTPPIVGMIAMQDTLAMIEEAGIAAIRAKSVALTSFAITRRRRVARPARRRRSPRPSTPRSAAAT